MQSLLIPSTISISLSSSHIKIVGPRGTFVTTYSGFTFRLLNTPEGNRLFAFPVEQSKNPLPSSTVLSLLSRRRIGLTSGYRHRLRLVGVGFRAVNVPATGSITATVSIKLGFSHEVNLSSSVFEANGVKVTPSRLDGRTKGTVLQFEGSNPSTLYHEVARVQKFRRPDPYKAKGIHSDGQDVRRKKGKREA
jgi:large subunit ribosomal protein L6